MDVRGKATRIALMDFTTPQMRAFHLTWLAFFLCFFGWFGIAPLMAVVRQDLLLTRAQTDQHGDCLGGHYRVDPSAHRAPVRPLWGAPHL